MTKSGIPRVVFLIRQPASVYFSVLLDYLYFYISTPSTEGAGGETFCAHRAEYLPEAETLFTSSSAFFTLATTLYGAVETCATGDFATVAMRTRNF